MTTKDGHELSHWGTWRTDNKGDVGGVTEQCHHFSQNYAMKSKGSSNPFSFTNKKEFIKKPKEKEG